MKWIKTFRVLIILLLPAAALAQPQLVHEWSNALNTYPSYTRGETKINGSVKDAANNFYLAGTFSFTADFDPTAAELNMTAESTGTGENIFLAKYTAAGVISFAKRIGAGAGILTLTGVTIDTDNNIYLSGQITGRGDFDPGEAAGETLWLDAPASSGFVAKYNSNGILQYAFLLETRLTQSGIFLYGIKVGSNNLLYLAGTYSGSIDIDPGAGSTLITTSISNPQGVFITYNKNTGVLNSSATFSHTGSLMGVSDMALDAQNNCLIVGSFGGTLSFTGSPVTLTSSGNTDIFVASWNDAGTLQQARRAGGTGADRGRAILKGADGSLYISASFSGTADVNLDPAITTNIVSTGADGFLTRYAPDGTLAYAFEISTVNKMLLVTNDTLIVSGLFKGTRDFNPTAGVNSLSSALSTESDIYAASYAPNGNYNWAFRLSSTGPKFINGLVGINGNQFIVAGDYQSNLNTNPAGSTTYSSLANKSNSFFSIYQNTSTTHVFTGIIGVNRTAVDMTKAVASNAAGDVFATGYFAKTIDADPTPGVLPLVSAGGQDIFFSKYNRSGQLQFAYRFGGTLTDQGKCIALDNSGNVYLAGTFSGTVNFDPSASPNPAASFTVALGQDIFISKYSPAGQWLFTKQIGGAGTELLNKMAIDKDGNIIIAGCFFGTSDFDPDPAVANNRTSLGNYDGFVAKYSGAGNLVYAHQLGGTGYDEAFGAGTGPAGEVYVCGTFSATVDFNPGAGILNLTVVSGASRDGFFAKFNAAGDLQFAYGLGSTSADQANEIITDRAGNIVVAGYFYNTMDMNPDPGITNNLVSAGSNDVFIAWYTPAGSYIRAIRTGGTALDEPRAISYDDGNNIIVAGRFSGTSDFNPDDAVTYNLTGAFTDAFVAAYSPTGQFIFANKFGAFDQDDALGLAVDTITKAIYIGGQFDLSVNFTTPGRPDAILQTDINANAFVARYSTVPLASSFTWTGNISTAWENAGNWAGNVVPAATSVVVIPTGRPRYPLINTSTTIKSLTCQTGATVNVSSGVVFTIVP